ncbi:MAG TPA: hypothetical protein VGM51_11230 [Armatimonadota bacterium]
MKSKLLLLAAMGVMAVLVAGCGGGGGGDTDVSRIKGRYRELQKGIENKDIQRAMSVYSYSYLDYGYTYDDVKNGFANLFIDWNNIQEDQVFHDIRVAGNMAYVNWTETLTATDANTGQVSQSVQTYDDVLHWENGDWYLYGNQQSAAPAAKRALRYSGQRLREAPAKPR